MNRRILPDLPSGRRCDSLVRTNGLHPASGLLAQSIHTSVLNIRGSSEKETIDGTRAITRRGKPNSPIAPYITTGDLWKSRGILHFFFRGVALARPSRISPTLIFIPWTSLRVYGNRAGIFRGICFCLVS